MSAALDVRPSVDRRWLERAAAREPLAHAYALWDLDRAPQTVRFVSVRSGDETLGYLMLWFGPTGRTVVHWYGPPALTANLRPALPAPPFVAIVPPEVAPTFAATFPGAARSDLTMMLRPADPVAPFEADVRRLRPTDLGTLSNFVRTRDAADLAGYLGLDLDEEPVYGAFDRGRLVGVTRAAVRLPRLWVVSGVYVGVVERRRGFGGALVAAAVAEAARSGAATGLYVRNEPPEARRLYDRLGYRDVGHRVWFDVRRAERSVGVAPPE